MFETNTTRYRDHPKGEIQTNWTSIVLTIQRRSTVSVLLSWTHSLCHRRSARDAKVLSWANKNRKTVAPFSRRRPSAAEYGCVSSGSGAASRLLPEHPAPSYRRSRMLLACPVPNAHWGSRRRQSPLCCRCLRSDC